MRVVPREGAIPSQCFRQAYAIGISRNRREAEMTRTTTVGILALAALLEAGGDALIRTGIHSGTNIARIPLFGLGATVLFAYGLTVNTPPWDFGKLLGLYVVFFFVFAQVISWLLFKQLPSTGIFIGGALIMIGGVVIAFANK
jgi:drug/metabolite transporter superfamily protein YnfA